MAPEKASPVIVGSDSSADEGLPAVLAQPKVAITHNTEERARNANMI
jgi:hypothetical protein